MKTVNWGIVGTGNIASSFARDFAFTTGGKITAVASRNMESAGKFCDRFAIEKAYGSYDELFEDQSIDIVYIATPHHVHYQNAADAMKSGKAVLCEKPITTCANDCKKLIEISHSTGSYLMEAMWTSFLPPILKAKEMIAAGNIGSIKKIKADFCFKANYNPSGRLFNPELAGGALLDIGIYPIALTQLILGEFPEKISVFSYKANTGVDLEETMIFEYKSGVIANLTSSLAYQMPCDALIVGEDGYIHIPDFFMARECFLYRNAQLVEHFRDPRTAVGYNYEIEAVQHDLMLGRTASQIMPLENSLELQKIMDAVRRKF
jgi:dihydrodiol dehydrogenase / D-xylose 1-dehydrogenase (NADP)